MTGAVGRHAVRGSGGDALSHRGGRVHLLVVGEDTGGRLAVVETVEARGSDHLCRVHTREDRAVYVLEGQVRFRVDGAWLSHPAGTCVLLPRGCEHTYAVESERARLLVIVVPAGLEGYYQEMADWDASPHAAVPDFERLVTVAARYGIEIVLPEARNRAGQSEVEMGQS